MLKQTKIEISGIQSLNDKNAIETEIDVLEGVKNINIQEQTGVSQIEFDDSKISEQKIAQKIIELGFGIKESQQTSSPALQEHTYFVKGMHCASCEIIIEKKLLSIQGVKSIEAKANKGEIYIKYAGKRPRIEMLNSIFRKENYTFSDEPIKQDYANVKKGSLFYTITVPLLIIIGFLYINKSGLMGLINPTSTSSLPTFFFMGILAGISSCAALVGGLILSMSKQWQGIYAKNSSLTEKLQPHLMFNTGRILAYGILGTVLGIIGSKIQVSFQFTVLLILAISILMIAMALQMLGVKAFRKFQFTLPKSFTRYIADEKNFQGKYMPFLMGAATFFLPCGFTITAQGLALLSGNAIQGGLIMASFALGTAPALLLIGLSSIKFSEKPHLAYNFSKIAGVLILFFALFNINSQLNLLGIKSLSDITIASNKTQKTVDDKDLPQVVSGKQVIKMQASSNGYSPNYFKVKVGVPVRWEITDAGTSGCTNAVISKGLFADSISLTPGQTSIKEFTPQKTGKYKFSCWMGMISGVIEVVDTSNASSNNSVLAANDNPDSVVPSGAKGCGCGGGGSGTCGGQ